MMSVVVVPMSMRIAFGCRRATKCAVAAQFGGSHGEGLCLCALYVEKAPVDRVDVDLVIAKGIARSIEYESDAFALGAKELRELGGHGEGVSVAVFRADFAGGIAEEWRERLGVALHSKGWVRAAGGALSPCTMRATLVFTPPMSHPTMPVLIWAAGCDFAGVRSLGAPPRLKNTALRPFDHRILATRINSMPVKFDLLGAACA